MAVCEQVLPKEIAAMIMYLVQTLNVTTVGDLLNTIGKINRGVTQGGLACPVLFNIYIDELAKRLQNQIRSPDGPSQGRFYVDDVVTHVCTMCEQQQALQMYEKWAIDFGMKWPLANGKSQILLSQERATRYKSFPFAAGHIRTVPEAI